MNSNEIGTVHTADWVLHLSWWRKLTSSFNIQVKTRLIIGQDFGAQPSKTLHSTWQTSLQIVSLLVRCHPAFPIDSVPLLSHFYCSSQSFCCVIVQTFIKMTKEMRAPVPKLCECQ